MATFSNGTECPTIAPTRSNVSKNGGNFINQYGKYKGKIEQLYFKRAPSGAGMIWIDFISDTGQKALLSRCLINKNGDVNLFGEQFLNDLAACMRQKENPPVQGSYQVYDFDTKAMLTKQGTIYPTLCGEIGLLITTEDGNGKYKNLNINKVFCPKTELTAYEIMERKTEPLALANSMQYLTANNLWHKEHTTQPPTNSYQQTVNTTPAYDDDIPF